MTSENKASGKSNDGTHQKIFAIANQKGGVGKTTTAVNLATAFSALGHNVLLIDMDAQGNATTGLGIKRAEIKKSVYHVLFGQAGVTDTAMQTKIPRLSIIPSSVHLSGAEVELAGSKFREMRLKKALEKTEYDYIILDCPPSLSFLTLNALVAAQGVIVPLQCEFYALEGLTQLTKTVRRVQKSINPELDIHGIVLTMYDQRNRISRLVAQDVRRYFKDRVFETVIPRNVRLAEAPSYGLPALVYDMKSAGAQAYIRLAKEMQKRDKPDKNNDKVEVA